MSAVLYVFCYVALSVFLIGLVARAVQISSMPVHLRWELAPVPHEKGKSHYGGSYLEEFEWWTKKREKSLVAEMWYMFQEIFFLKGVWENNRRLWIFSFPFHQGLYFTIAATALFIACAVLQKFDVAVPHAALVALAVYWVALIGYSIGAFGTVGLFLSRLLDPRLRKFASFSSYFNLLFLSALFGSGLCAMRALGAADFTAQMTAFWSNAIGANWQALPAPLSLHMAVCFAFATYLPFTYMMHFVAKYFTYHQIRWDDRPMDAKIEKEVGKLLSQPVTWSAPHIRGDGKRNWIDIVTQEEKSK